MQFVQLRVGKLEKQVEVDQPAVFSCSQVLLFDEHDDDGDNHDDDGDNHDDDGGNHGDDGGNHEDDGGNHDDDCHHHDDDHLKHHDSLIHLEQSVWKERDGGHMDSSGHV